jgi:tetratricopeptide (TPR) repeat protein
MNKLGLLIIFSCLVSCATAGSKSSATIDLFKQAEEYYKKGLLTEAEASYLKLVKVSPGVTDAWVKLGNIYVRTGQLDAAVTMYEKCLHVDQKEARCWNNLALARVKQAMETLRQGQGQIELNSDEYYALERLYKKLTEVVMIKEQ